MGLGAAFGTYYENLEKEEEKTLDKFNMYAEADIKEEQEVAQLFKDLKTPYAGVVKEEQEVAQLFKDLKTPYAGVVKEEQYTPTNNNSSDIYITHENHNLGSGLYNPYTGKYGNKAYRNNNPGNITGMGGSLLYGASKIATSNTGDKGDQAQLVYDSPAKGWAAMHSLMTDKYSNKSIREEFSRWQSDQEAWKNMQTDLVSKGINIDKSFDELSPEEKTIFMNVRARHEGWTGDPITVAMLNN